MSRDNDRRPGFTRKEIEGFLQLLCATQGLPEATDEIVAYIERVGTGRSVDETKAKELAKFTIREITLERLRSTTMNAIRPLDLHLKAKRIAASCSVELVATVLRMDARRYELLESGQRDFLDEPATVLADVAQVFDLRLGELYKALVKYVARGRPRAQTRFARDGMKRISMDELAIAEEDLRSSGDDKPPVEAEFLKRIERKLSEVKTILEKKRSIS